MSSPPSKRHREEAPPEEDEEEKQVAMVRVILNKAHRLLLHCTFICFDITVDHEDSKDTDGGFTGSDKPGGPGCCLGDA